MKDINTKTWNVDIDKQILDWMEFIRQRRGRPIIASGSFTHKSKR